MASMTFKEEVKVYTKSLARFMYLYSLPEKWFTKPDHLAIKAKDAAAYDAHVEYWKDKAVKGRVSEIKMNGRRLGTVRLKEPFSVGPFGIISWIELMEPRPNMVGKDKVGLDHMEFYYPKFDEVMTALKERDVIAKLESNPSHEWISIILHDGHELKLNNGRLGTMVSKEIKQGLSRWV
jgi:predicted metalloenzyme YecM